MVGEIANGREPTGAQQIYALVVVNRAAGHIRILAVVQWHNLRSRAHHRPDRTTIIICLTGPVFTSVVDYRNHFWPLSAPRAAGSAVQTNFSCLSDQTNASVRLSGRLPSSKSIGRTRRRHHLTDRLNDSTYPIEIGARPTEPMNFWTDRLSIWPLAACSTPIMSVLVPTVDCASLQPTYQLNMGPPGKSMFRPWQ